MSKLVIGIDYGTDSCRALVIDTTSGKEIATYTSFYRRWKEGLFCNPSKNQYRQHPQDYIDSLEEVIRGVTQKLSSSEINEIAAIGIDTTGSTPCLTDKEGVPLALLPKHADNPNAMFFLWKDHTSIQEANEINTLSRNWEIDYTLRSGGTYSSEWFWAKALHALRVDASIREDAYTIIEHCDWMPALLTGNLKPEEVKRSRCAAGHKGMWAHEWNGYPSQDFFTHLDPLLNGFADNLNSETYTSDKSAGQLTPEWAHRLGLPLGVEVAIGIIDAHAGAVGAGIKANTMVKIVGTSTCDIIVTPKSDLKDKLIPGISGQVDGSVIPGLIGLEAGQSAFGDVYAWLRGLLSWSLSLSEIEDKKTVEDKILNQLTKEAESLPITDNGLIANDWLNGRRTPFADQSLKGGVLGLTLGTTPAEIFKSLVEATAFGSKTILDHIEKEGVKIKEVIAVGGISLKSAYVMQVLSDIMGVPITVAETQQAGALGSAMLASVATAIFSSVEEAQDALSQGVLSKYVPNKDNDAVYSNLYKRYQQLGRILSDQPTLI